MRSVIGSQSRTSLWEQGGQQGGLSPSVKPGRMMTVGSLGRVSVPGLSKTSDSKLEEAG